VLNLGTVSDCTFLKLLDGSAIRFGSINWGGAVVLRTNTNMQEPSEDEALPVLMTAGIHACFSP